MGFRPSKPAPPSSSGGGGKKINLGEMFGAPGANENFGNANAVDQLDEQGNLTGAGNIDQPYNKPTTLQRIFAPQGSAAADQANAGFKMQSVLSKQEAAQHLSNAIELANTNDAIQQRNQDQMHTAIGKIAVDNFPEYLPQGVSTPGGQWDYKEIGRIAKMMPTIMHGQAGEAVGNMGLPALTAQRDNETQANLDPSAAQRLISGNSAAVAQNDLIKSKANFQDTLIRAQAGAQSDPEYAQLAERGVIGKMRADNVGNSAAIAENELRESTANYGDTEMRAKATAQSDPSYAGLVSSNVLGRLGLANQQNANQSNLLSNYGEIMNAATVADMISKGRTTLPEGATSFSNLPGMGMPYDPRHDIYHGGNKTPIPIVKKGIAGFPDQVTGFRDEHHPGYPEHLITAEEQAFLDKEMERLNADAEQKKQAEEDRKKGVRNGRDNPVVRPLHKQEPLNIGKAFGDFLRGSYKN